MISKILEIPGGTFPVEVEHLAWIGKAYPRILEIGALFGRSTKALAYANTGHVDTVDSLVGEKSLPIEYQAYAGISGVQQRDMLAENLREELRSGKVRFYQMTSRAFYTLAWEGEKYDLIWIDGAHDTPSVMEDCAYALAMLAPDGLIMGHDANYGPVLEAVKTVFPGKFTIMAPPLERIWLAS